MVLVASVENAGQAVGFPHLNELHGGVAEGFLGGPNSGPRKYGFEVKTVVLDHAVTACLLRLMQSVEIWRNCVVGA